jgi:gentisate 1,2-dioxygenase/1-hydroxy-2-naphthoate dioxygenase
MTEIFPRVKTLAEFDRDLAELHLRGQWQYDAQLAQLKDGPMPAGIPFLWKWDMVHATLRDLCEVMPASTTARRNISFINPDPKVNGTSHTMVMGMQITLPGEIAWAHRHSINALRFVVDGSPDLYTVVDGEKCPMEANDLVLTPAYTWHDHHNDTPRHGIWIDILDVPLLGFLRQMFVENFGETTQPLRKERAEYISGRASLVRPAWEAQVSTRIPFRYPWSEVKETLQSFSKAEGSPYDGVILRYAHPISGGPTMPTLDCFVQLLRPGLATMKHRHTSSTVYYVIEGDGTTIVGDQKLNWAARDSFVVPNWMWHQHINRSRVSQALLFAATDAPLLAALGMYREEPQMSFGAQAYPAVPADLVVQHATRSK